MSDFLPCVGQNVRLTVTAWKSKDGSSMEQPKLQVIGTVLLMSFADLYKKSRRRETSVDKLYRC